MSAQRGQRGASAADLARVRAAQRLKQARHQQRGRSRIPRRPPSMSEVPLSFMQEQLWFLDQANPGLSAYNIPLGMRLRGALDVPALRRALAGLAARHEVLRARFIDYDGRPFQTVGHPPDVPLETVDLSTLPEAERDERLERERERLANHHFDLAKEPPIIARAAKAAEDDWVLLITVHHIAFDAWSYGVFLRELWALYEAQLGDSSASLDPEPIGYGDFALWQRDQLQGARLQELVDFWRERLAGELPVTTVPPDRERPAVQTFDGHLLRRSWDEGLAAGIERLAAERGTTPFVVLLAGFLALLHRYTGQDDLIVGVPIANREYPELEQLIGFFVNMVPVRVDLGDDPALETAVDRVAEAVLSTQANAALPFAKLVEIIQPERDPSRSPVFQTGFTYADNRGRAARPPAGCRELEILAPEEGPGQSRFDLSMTAERGEDGLVLNLEFNTDLYDLGKMTRLLGHLRELLADGLARPSAKVSELRVLTGAEWDQLVVEVNRTSAPLPTGTCVHEEIAARSAASPDAVAVADAESSVTYGELEARANRIARYLLARGIGDEDLVGVSMRRGARRVAAILGTLKAGAGYVPIDPSYPDDRIAFMVSDSGAETVLVDAATRERVRGLPAAALDLDESEADIARLEGSDPQQPVDPANVAYVIYTSGSTGTPKGVVIEHRSLVNFMHSTRRLFELSPEDRVLQFASLSFDVSVFEMFAGLGAGATVVIPDQDTILSPVRLTEFLRRERITVTDIPPTVMTLLDPSELEHLRIVFVGGEAFADELVRRWARPGRRFFNGYGPTESTVTVIAKELGGDTVGAPPMGRPMDNHTAYVVDRYLNPLPVGVPGELLVGGAGLARGYLGRPQLTGERFVPAPVPGAPWPRVYRTGDAARFLEGGDLQFVGRLDDQVKVRGFRIELGEVKARVLDVEGVREAAVRVRRDEHGHGRDLVAYVVAEEERQLDPEAIRRALADRLPAFMVPSHLVVLDELPLTGSGKVDVAALPEPSATIDEGASRPQGALEEFLSTEVFGPLLGLDAPAADASFFRLGGTSLQAMQVLSRLRNQLQVDVDVRDLFQNPSVSELAAVLQRRYGVTEEAALDAQLAAELEGLSDDELEQVIGEAPGDGPDLVVGLSQRTDAPAVACVHPVSGSVAPYVPLAAALEGRLALYGVQSPPSGDEADIAAGERPTVEELADRYLDALAQRLGDVPTLLLGWSMGGLIAYEVGRRLAQEGATVSVALLDTSPPDEEADHSEEGLVLSFARDAAASLGLPDPQAPDGFGELPLDAKLRALTAQWADAGVAAQDSGVLGDPLERFALFRNHALAGAEYEPRPTSARLLLVQAADSDHAAGRWRDYARGEWRHVTVPGDHYDLVSPQGSETLSQHLLEHLSAGSSP